jgi:hypothetical protein
MSTSPRPASRRRVISRILLPAVLGLAATSVPASGATLSAPAASTFRDSIGVQLHTDFQGFAYQADTTDRLVSAVKGIGVRHVRDRVCMDKPDVCAKVYEKLDAVGDAYGPGTAVDLVVGVMPNVDAPTDRAARDALIASGLRQVRDASYAPHIAALEMVNEPDLLKTGDWAAQTVQDARSLHRLLATTEFASLAKLPVLAPALGRQTMTPELLKAGWTPDLADLPNLHPYPATYTIPETALDLPCEGAGTVLGCAQSMATQQRSAIATESGYSTAGNILVSDWVTQRAQATYSLRLLLNNFAAGVDRTYLYELVDLSPTPTFRNHGYGLMTARLNADNTTFRIGSPKLAYLALQRMNTIVGDLGAAAHPGTLDVAITDPATGASIPDDAIERVAMRRADGSYVLALWQRAQSFSFLDYKPRDLTVPARQVEVQLDGSRGGWSAQRYVPALSGGTLGTLTGSTLSVPINDDVTLLTLTPPAGFEPTPPTPTTTPTPTATPAATPTPTGVPAATPAPVVTPLATNPAATSPTSTPPATPAPSDAATAPHTDAPRPAAASQTTTPAAPLLGRDQAAADREKASRRARARMRANRAYAACLDRRVARAQRRTREDTEHPRLSRPTPEMRAQCDRSLAR